VKKVFIIGDTGLVGRACIKLFNKSNYAVYGFSRREVQACQSENYTHYAMNVLSHSQEFFEKFTAIKPDIIICTAGNHEKETTTENSQALIDLHLSFIPSLVNTAIKEKLSVSIVCCSSWMAYIPDRKYPVYTGVKAALNQYVYAARIILPSQLLLKAVVLGPIAAKPNKWFEKSAKDVAEAIVRLAEKKSSGVYFYPKYGKLLQLSSGLLTNSIEKLIFRKRRL